MRGVSARLGCSVAAWNTVSGWDPETKVAEQSRRDWFDGLWKGIDRKRVTPIARLFSMYRE